MYNHWCMETYRSGRTEPHSKCGCREIGTWVRIPPFPPEANCTHTHNELLCTFFVSEDCFGICVYFGTKKNLYAIIN